ncbi:MAG: hypothetical protein Q4E91_14205, partial [Lachnospiraceae bacterium]|nr:hypothetical protein [Lachnospiraceae bacterium]
KSSCYLLFFEFSMFTDGKFAASHPRNRNNIRHPDRLNNQSQRRTWKQSPPCGGYQKALFPRFLVSKMVIKNVGAKEK